MPYIFTSNDNYPHVRRGMTMYSSRILKFFCGRQRRDMSTDGTCTPRARVTFPLAVENRYFVLCFPVSSFFACWTACQAMDWSFLAADGGTLRAAPFLPDLARVTLAGRPTGDLLYIVE